VDDTSTSLAAELEQVALLCLSRALTCHQRRMVEAALERARAVLSGGKDDIEHLRQWCHEHGYTVHRDRVSLRCAADMLGVSYSYLRGLRIGRRFGRGRRGYLELQEVARLRRDGLRCNR
jgi:hypothetical protein